MANKSVIIKIKRQNTPTSKSYWEEFELAYRPGMNVISSLMEIAANPVTRDGKATTPITYDSNCLEEVCGSCAMLINGRARMACSALIDNLEQPVRLEPFSKFPIVRDLATDRSVIFENLKAVKAWIPIDGTYDLGPGPRQCQAVGATQSPGAAGDHRHLAGEVEHRHVGLSVASRPDPARGRARRPPPGPAWPRVRLG